MYKRNITNAPDCLVKNDAYLLGCYNTPVQRANLLDYPNPYSIPLPKVLKNLQLREWQAFQMFNGRHFVMAALYNAKKLALVQFILFDTVSLTKFRYEVKVAPWKVQIPDSLYGTKASYTDNTIAFDVIHDVADSKLNIDVRIRNYHGLPDLKAHFNAVHDVKKHTPMVVCLPFSDSRVMYSHKCLMPLEGNIIINDMEELIFPRTSSSLILDDHKGYYPFPTKYDWVTGIGTDDQNIRFGFNLTDNQVIDQRKYNENGFWYDGVLYPLPPIKVERPRGYQKTWFIKDEFGSIDLEFTPIVHNEVAINLLLFKSKYQGPYGYFNGIIKTLDKAFEVKNCFGMGEDFYLRV